MGLHAWVENIEGREAVHGGPVMDGMRATGPACIGRKYPVMGQGMEALVGIQNDKWGGSEAHNPPAEACAADGCFCSGPGETKCTGAGKAARIRSLDRMRQGAVAGTTTLDTTSNPCDFVRQPHPS